MDDYIGSGSCYLPNYIKRISEDMFKLNEVKGNKSDGLIRKIIGFRTRIALNYVVFTA